MQFMSIILLFFFVILTECHERATIFPDTQHTILLSGDNGPNWTIRSDDGVYGNLKARVPGDILSDLMANNVIENPYFDRNFLDQRNIWMGIRSVWNSSSQLQLERRTRIWIYETFVELDQNRSYQLVLEGVKMGASVAINGVHLGTVTNQFLRYEFDLPEVFSFEIHSTVDAYSRMEKERGSKKMVIQLSITFDPAIETNGRFTACSGGWDWAPYSKAGDERGSRVFTFGIVQPIYIIEVESVSITHVAPKITYIDEEVGDYPTSPLLDGPHYDFRVDVDVHIKIHKDTQDDKNHVILLRSDFSDEIKIIHIHGMQAGTETTLTDSMTASKDVINLWWPNGYGSQHLYHIFVSYQNQKTVSDSGWIKKVIGFRICNLVTIDDTNKTLVNETIENDIEGSGHHGMYFRVNGALIWARGANVVPMDQLEGRLTDEAHRIMVQSAAKANMNMLRVWGGGMILSRAFYESCDELGILIYHDMMFVEEQFHGALRIKSVEMEIRHIVRSLISHPSIVLWSGCNECAVEMGKPTEVYATFVMQIVSEEDSTRSVWPSCPSDSGWKTGVSRITGKPNGKEFSTYLRNSKQRKLELHGPYQHGYSASFPCVNGHDDGRNYTTNTPPSLEVHIEISPSSPNSFVSEFGISSFSSFESMSATISPNNWGMHGSDLPNNCTVYDGNVNICEGENVLAERNYACDSHIDAFFGSINDKEVSEHYFKCQLFHCMVATALWMKGQIEILRSSNSFGALIWQLNENWPTGGWGLVEYGAQRNEIGQSSGGRWKPIMHLLRQSLFRDVFVACGKDGICFCRNDGIYTVQGEIFLETWSSINGDLLGNQSKEILLEGGMSHSEWFQLDRNITDLSDVLLLSFVELNGSFIIENYVVLWSVPKDIRAAYLTAKISIVDVVMVDRLINIILESDQLALYVVITTPETGVFDMNAFALKPDVRITVKFSLSFGGPVDLEKFKEEIRVEHLGSYL